MIRLLRDGALAELVLDRADKRNALATEDWRALARVARDVPDDAAAVLIRAADPRVFCAGADLADLARLVEDVPARDAFRDAMRDGIEAVAALPMPLIAAVEGGCFGAGVALALAADVIVAGEGARFAIPPARLGIGYPPADVARLIARVGQGQTARLLFTGAAIDADEALAMKLADLAGDGVVVAHEIAGNDAAALRLLKRTVRDPHRADGAAAFAASFGSATFATGIARWRRP